MGQETLVKLSQKSIGGIGQDTVRSMPPKSEEHPGNLHIFFCFGRGVWMQIVFFLPAQYEWCRWWWILVEARRLFGGGFNRFFTAPMFVEMIQFDDNCCSGWMKPLTRLTWPLGLRLVSFSPPPRKCGPTPQMWPMEYFSQIDPINSSQMYQHAILMWVPYCFWIELSNPKMG